MGDVVMVSGGLDSLLAAHIHPRATRVFVEWGQPYLELERRAVSGLYPDARTIRIDGLPSLSGQDFYVPARNLMFATIGARFGDRICLAGMRDEMCPDKNPDAFRAMSSILTAQCRERVEVFSPFWNCTKSEAVKAFLNADGDSSLLVRSVSCYGSGDVPCLDCEACFRRFVALQSNDINVPRPSDAVIKTYGLNRIYAVPMATAHATLKALHVSGLPVVGVEIHDFLTQAGPACPGLQIVFSENRNVKAEVIQQTLVSHDMRFDGVMVGVNKDFFDFHGK